MNRLSYFAIEWCAVVSSLLLSFFVCVASAEKLPAEISEAIKASPVKAESVSLWVAHADGGNPIIDYNSNIPRKPASVEKLLTTGVGLFLLGENFRWRTEFYTNGKISNKTLKGNLYVKGHGDPYLVEESLMDMIVELRNIGIEHIQGDVILDNSYFMNTMEDPDFFDGHGLESYNALPNALSINFRTSKLHFLPENGKVSITSTPALTYTSIQNNMTLNKSKRCRGKGFNPRIAIDKTQDLIIVSGSMSNKCKKRTVSKVMTDAGDLFYGHLKSAWELSGGAINGKWHYGKVPSGVKKIYSGISKPLATQIKAMNKYSNNVMTRQLFLTIGAELTQPPGTLEKSQAVVVNKMKSLGVPTSGLIVDNGSGLSRKSRITALQLGRFLIAMQDTRVKHFFEKSLSVVGVDGTLRKRLLNTPLAGNAIGKTGTLKNAKAVAGYLTAKSGKKYVYVMLFNGTRARSGRPLMDQVMKWIYAQN